MKFYLLNISLLFEINYLLGAPTGERRFIGVMEKIQTEQLSLSVSCQDCQLEDAAVVWRSYYYYY